MPDALRSMWEEGLPDREPFLERARRVAKVTIPSIAPDLGMTRGEDLPRPLSTIGARGLNNMSSKLTIGLFPPQAPPFKYAPDEIELLRAGITPEQLDDVKLALSKRERAVQTKLDRSGFRPVSVEGFLQLLCSGNYLYHLLPEGRVRGFRMDQFQVRRNAKDQVDRVLAHETVYRSTLPADLQRKVQPTIVFGYEDLDLVDLLTVAIRVPSDSPSKPDRWRTWQEVGGQDFTPETILSDVDLPWIPVRMMKDSNEHYGRSFCEDYLGSLEFVEALEQALADHAIIAAKTVPIVDPASGLRPNDIATAENGKVLVGRPDGVGFLRADKGIDMQIAFNLLESLKQDLRQVFLLLTPFRDAERVTQEEIRQTVAELSEALGGSFALLSDELQRPLVEKLIRRMVSRGELLKIEELDELDRDIKIVTGIDAIGRSREEAQLISFAQAGQLALGPAIFAEYAKPSGWLTALAAAQGNDPEALVRTEEEVAQSRAAAAQQALQERAAGAVVREGAAIARASQGAQE